MVNVPMFFCVRRLVSPIILLYKYIRFGRVAESGVQLSVACFVVGTLVAGWDKDPTGQSVGWALLAAVLAGTQNEPKGHTDPLCAARSRTDSACDLPQASLADPQPQRSPHWVFGEGKQSSHPTPLTTQTGGGG